MMAVSLSPPGVGLPRRLCCPHIAFAARTACASSSTSTSGSSSSRLSIFCSISDSRAGVRSSAVTELASSAGLRTEREAAGPLLGAPHSDAFLNVTSEDELLAGIWGEVEAKRLPRRGGAALVELYNNYRDAALEGGLSKEGVVKIMATVCDRIILQFKDPFTFQPHHERMIEPYNYYEFGQNYIRPLINFSNSYVGNVGIFDEMQDYLKQGHNILLYSNHQTEADPAVIALLLESTHPYLSENLTYVAGDRVVSDPFLHYVFAKMFVILNLRQYDHLEIPSCNSQEKGLLIWIAPSGGRDRPDPVTDEWNPATFDSSAVDHMRRLMLSHGTAPGHMYAMSLLSYDVMPPPKQVEKELGEQRLMNHTGCGLAVSPELRFAEITAGIADLKREGREVFAKSAYKIVKDQYDVLAKAVDGGLGLAASTPSVQLSQPWIAKLSSVPQ